MDDFIQFFDDVVSIFMDFDPICWQAVLGLMLIVCVGAYVLTEIL